MGPMRREVDDLTLMDPEDAVRPPGHQQRQVRERGQAAITQQHIAGAELGMEPRHPGHVVGAQRGGQDLDEHPRTDVE